MAKQTTTITETTDDLEGGPADETVFFSLDGIDYEIDLNTKNAEELRDFLEDHVNHGRKVGGRRAPKVKPVAPEVDLTALRQWAAENGIQVAARGRIAKEVLDRYRSEVEAA